MGRIWTIENCCRRYIRPISTLLCPSNRGISAIFARFSGFSRNCRRILTMKNISLLGCGLMGTPMGHRLLAAGYRLTVWNRSADKTTSLAQAGARVAPTPAQAVQGTDLVITMLTDGPAVHDVLFDGPNGAAHGLSPGALVVDMSSITPAEAQAHAARLLSHGAACVDAPVSGGTLGAQAGTLAIMAGGQATDVERAHPVLQHLGRVVHVGPAGCGQLTKLANQIIVGVGIGAVAEALLLARQGGADMAQVRLALRGGFAESRVLEVHGERMVMGDFAKRGSLAVQLKDLRNALATAQGLGFDAPISRALTELFEDAARHGDADKDQSALFLELARRQTPT